MYPFFQHHAEAIIAVIASHGAMLLIAVVSTMPSPDKPFSLYRWIYDTAHLFLNLMTEGKTGIQPPQPPKP